MVATVNAVNFVDGLDGLAAGVVGIGAVAFFAFAYKLADANNETLAISAALLCAALGGACVGFLPHNFFPARIFMGDSGSMLIGLVLSGSALTLTGQFANVDMSQGAGGSQASLLPTLLPIILPISILIVPFADLVLAVIRRTRAGRSPFAPDKQHLHHRLLEIGHSHRRAVLIMWLWAGLIAFGGVLASLYASRLTLLLLGVWVVVTVALTFVVPRVQRPVSSCPLSSGFPAAAGLCASFHKHRQPGSSDPDDQGRPPHDDRTQGPPLRAVRRAAALW